MIDGTLRQNIVNEIMKFTKDEVNTVDFKDTHNVVVVFKKNGDFFSLFRKTYFIQGVTTFDFSFQVHSSSFKSIFLASLDSRQIGFPSLGKNLDKFVIEVTEQYLNQAKLEVYKSLTGEDWK
jgi:hypothetical protein